MRYRYYIVYNYYKNNGNGVGCLTHERNDKLDDIEKIIGLQASVLKNAQGEDENINQLIITNFILIDEFEVVRS